MGKAVDTIPSILNKCLFVSPDRRTDGRRRTTDGRRLNGYTISSPCEPKGSGELQTVYISNGN